MPQWTFVYQYTVGGAVFVLSIWLLVRAGEIDPHRRSGRRALGLLIGGLLGYAALHALSVFWLPST